MFVSSGSTLDRLQFLTSAGHVWVSNSLSCLLATSACQASETDKTAKQEGSVGITAIDEFIAEFLAEQNAMQTTTQSLTCA